MPPRRAGRPLHPSYGHVRRSNGVSGNSGSMVISESGGQMELDANLLRDSFQLVVSREPDLTIRFYRVLFRRKPELEAMFHRRPRDVQARMLGEALGAVLDHLEDAPWLAQQLSALGATHVDYGVTRAMYDDVGGALLETLAEVADSAWTAELEEQWSLAYATIRDLMLAGASKRAGTVASGVQGLENAL